MCYADTWCFILKAVKNYSSLPCEKRNLVAERGVNAFQKVKRGSCGRAGKTDLA